MIRWLIRLIGLLGLAGAVAANAQYATLTGTLQSSNGLPAANYTISFVPNQWGFIAGTGVMINTTTYCGTDPAGSVVGITNPLQPTINTPSYSGGTLAAGNYFVTFTWATAGPLVTQTSPESTAQLTGTGNLQVAPPASGVPAGALFMNVYIGTSSGAETYQGQIAAGNVYTQSVALVSGANPPAINTTTCKQVANDAIWPVGTGYTVSLTDPSGNTLPGYPMTWQILGPNTTLNLSNGLPYYHGIVTYPSPILASPLNHATQSISGGLTIGTYPMLAGKFGVNVVTPAWGADIEGAGALGAINAKAGYLFNGAAPANHVLLANGTYYVDSATLPCTIITGSTAPCGTVGLPTITVGANAGAGAVAVCAPASTCTNVSGRILIGAGPGAATGAILTLTWSTPFFFAGPNCVVGVGAGTVSGGGPALIGWVSDTTKLTVSSVLTPLSNGGQYFLSYVCSGT